MRAPRPSIQTDVSREQQRSPTPSTTTRIATHAAVTAACRRARRRTRPTVAGTMIRPRRPVGRSRADQAVTASRSRSRRYWSGTSTASIGTNRAASIATTSRPPTPPGRSTSARAASVVTTKTATPTIIHTRSPSSPGWSRARATAAVTAATRPATPRMVGKPLGRGVPRDDVRRRAGEGRDGQHPVPRERPDGQHPDDGGRDEHDDRRLAQVGALGQARGQPPGEHRDGTTAASAPERRERAGHEHVGADGVRRDASAAAAGRASPVATSTAPVTTPASASETVGRTAVGPGGCRARAPRGGWPAVSTPGRRRRSSAAAGTCRSRTPTGPWTLTRQHVVGARGAGHRASRVCQRLRGRGGPWTGTVVPAGRAALSSVSRDRRERGTTTVDDGAALVSSMSTSDAPARRSPRSAAAGSSSPRCPSGQLVLQPPPQIQQSEGAAGVAMNAIPMLGSLGSIVLVATISGRRGRRGGKQLHRGRHVPVRHARLHHRPDRPAAQAARPAGHRLAHRVPALPLQRPQGRPRGRRPSSAGR